MREVARDVGLVSSAVFRYFDSRDSLLTALLIENYEALGSALAGAVEGERGAAAWRAAAAGLRRWTLERPHDFQLLYGTPVPGYQAPSDTVAAAALVAAPFLDAVSGARMATLPTALQEDFTAILAERAELRSEHAAAAVAGLLHLAGHLLLELAGHLMGVVADREAFYGHVVDQQVACLGLV